MDWRSEDIELLRQLVHDGWSYSRIAEKIPGATKKSAAAKAYRLKLKFNPPPKPPEDKMVATHTYAVAQNGVTLPKLKRQCGYLRELEIESEPSIEEIFASLKDPGKHDVGSVDTTPPLLMLGSDQCRYPTRRGKDGHEFCGAKRKNQFTSYCCEHHKLCCPRG